jgi:transcription elongation factor GreA-like protein/transcription elongation GreA/GreB family factor
MKQYAPYSLELYDYYKKQGNWDKAISILKKIIKQEPENNYLRDEVIECLTQKYGNFSCFQDALDYSEITQSGRHLTDAIIDFEKCLLYKKDNYVFHKRFGIGKINDVKFNILSIDFFNLNTGEKIPSKKMGIETALKELTILPKEHIWVIMRNQKFSDLKSMALRDVKGTLKTIMNNCANFQLIKKQLTRIIKREVIFNADGILNELEWATWSKEAVKVMETEHDFKIILDNFFDRYAFFEDYLKATGKKDGIYNNILNYFLDVYRTTNNYGEKIACWFLLENTGNSPSESFAEFYSQIPDVVAAFCSIPVQRQKLIKKFLKKITEIEGWPDIYCRLFPYYLGAYIPKILLENKYTDKVMYLFEKYIKEFNIYCWPFVWICGHADEYSFIEFILPKEEEILEIMLSLLKRNNDNTSRYDGKKDNDILLSKYIEQYLFDSNNNKNKLGRFGQYVRDAGREKAYEMLVNLEMVTGLSKSILSYYRTLFNNKYPDITINIKKPKEVIITDKFLATQAGLDRKNKELRNIEYEIKKASSEISEIIGQDEKQAKKPDQTDAKRKFNELSIVGNNLANEISNAQVFDKKNLNLNKVSFGTKVTLRDLDSNQNVVYTILGPFESEPEKNIISHQAQLAVELLGAGVDEVRHFEINGTKYNFKVLSIEASEKV